jgi:ACS family tartrate transporter-like MFS transporter
LAYFFLLSANYGFALWLPKLIQAQSGLAVMEVSLLTALPYLFEIPVVMLISWHSDIAGERPWHAAAPITIGALAFAGSQWAAQNVWLLVSLLCLSAMGMHSYRGPFWALPSLMLNRSATAASIGIISSVGNLGGFVGPYAVGLLSNYTGAYRAGVLYLVICTLLASLIIAAVGIKHKRLALS